jgi:hypothetical protein
MTQPEQTQRDARLIATDIERWDYEGGASQAPKKKIPKYQKYSRLVRTSDDGQKDS